MTAPAPPPAVPADVPPPPAPTAAPPAPTQGGLNSLVPKQPWQTPARAGWTNTPTQRFENIRAQQGGTGSQQWKDFKAAQNRNANAPVPGGAPGETMGNWTAFKKTHGGFGTRVPPPTLP